jgi:periplasmic protein TonB
MLLGLTGCRLRGNRAHFVSWPAGGAGPHFCLVPGAAMRHDLPEVYTPAEVARAAGVAEAEVQALVDAGAIEVLPTGSTPPLIAAPEAVRVGRALRAGVALTVDDAPPIRPAALFRPPARTPTAPAPFVISTAGHAAAVGLIVLATTLGLGGHETPRATEAIVPAEQIQLVYLALPGPGGGGGGGGLREPAPPPKAERKGTRSLSSPLPARQPPPRQAPAPRRPEPPPQDPEPLPPVEAPVVTVASDDRDRPGVMQELPRPRSMPDSRGPGSGGGVGSGTGTGLGEGDGSGIGDGSGGGMGGGVYRPGSGIEPPSLLREVKPDYTEEARRRGVAGEVVMEIVVRRDGSVGEVRVLQGLGYGLDQRAVEAVRQWRFSPARRQGTPVDVMVEVAMEFKLR